MSSYNDGKWHGWNGGEKMYGITDILGYAHLDADELTAATDTMTAISDAMADSSGDVSATQAR